MRPIKFRAKEQGSDKWVYGLLSFDGQEGYRDWLILTENGDYIVIDLETVGQYTGKKLDNGDEVYEGHILEDEEGDVGVVEFGELPLDKSGDCVCTYPAFYVRALSRNAMYECFDIGGWMKIISNRIDRPELLEKK